MFILWRRVYRTAHCPSLHNLIVVSHSWPRAVMTNMDFGLEYLMNNIVEDTLPWLSEHSTHLWNIVSIHLHSYTVSVLLKSCASCHLVLEGPFPEQRITRSFGVDQTLSGCWPGARYLAVITPLAVWRCYPDIYEKHCLMPPLLSCVHEK